MDLVKTAKTSNENVAELLKQEEYGELREAIGLDLDGLEGAGSQTENADGSYQREDTDAINIIDELVEILTDDMAQITMRNSAEEKGVAKENAVEDTEVQEEPEIIRKIEERLKKELIVDRRNSNMIIVRDHVGKHYCRFKIKGDRVNFVVFKTEICDWDYFSEKARTKNYILESEFFITIMNIQMYDMKEVEEMLEKAQLVKNDIE